LTLVWSKSGRIDMKINGIATITAVVLWFSVLSGASVFAKSGHFVTAQNQKRDSKFETFTGTIAKKGDQFVLTDDSSKMSYSLDDQQTAEKFAGKKVRVKGILDAVNNTIRIQDIEEAAA
jgi:hypothetical protein